MTRRTKNKGRKPPPIQNNTPKKSEDVSPKSTPTKTPDAGKPPPKVEENNNPKETKKDVTIDEDGEEAEWCIHLDDSSPADFHQFHEKPLKCICCSQKAVFSCIHKDCVKDAASNCCKDLKHLFPHMMQHKHPAFIQHELEVILCTRCDVRSSLKYFMERYEAAEKKKKAMEQALAIKKKRPFELRGLIGYVNFGNTCYMNAILQFLGHCPSFKDYLCNFVPPGGWERCSPDIPKTVIQMALDLRGIHSAVQLPFSSPWKIISCVRNEMPDFDCFQQQDASEFLRNLLDIVDRDLKACSEYYEHNTPIGYGNPEDDYDIALEARTTRTIISELFQGSLENKITCRSCGFQSVTTENFLDLSIPIVCENEFDEMFTTPQRKPPRIDPVLEGYSHVGRDPGFLVHQSVKHKTDLDSCLDMFFQTSELREDNQYSCSNCERLVDATKTTKAQRLPEYIIIQLKRFRHTVYGSSKIGKTIEFPIRLQDFGRWTTTGEPEIYELIGFVVHEGRSVECGHYVTFSKHEVERIWYKYDDVNVRRLDESLVARNEPYILMYKKCKPSKPKAPAIRDFEPPFNFFHSKRLFTDKLNEAWDVVDRHLESLPETDKTQKVFPIGSTPLFDPQASKEMNVRNATLLRRKNTRILAKRNIPLAEAKQHVAELERILAEIQHSRTVKKSNRPENKASPDNTLKAVNLLVSSIESWLKAIIKKEWMAAQPDYEQLQAKKNNNPSTSKN
ncbi:hypothetical protein CAEBREN_19736 [Caenorhabditis brenneri]|uniref:Ubiquitin carboxyl-terminal hydrolase n=1 Tax=Caenorhabditis brenneri TaxID=135651 RepID=G0MAU2_CAEBE|nr:hypothetical protein CAEBREN_19736 [Caenorhabditis brenneri]